MIKSKLQRKIGKFEIGKVIGRGTFGKVREGVHSPTGCKVAIKILQKKRIKSSKDIKRIQIQLQILKQINHPNILKLLQVKQTEKQIFIVTQLVKGQQLFDRILKKGSLQIDEACRYFIQLYEAVRFLHHKNIAHRDIKPENIIVDGDNLKLIDFGLSTLWGQSKNIMQTPCGSPCYAAPQIIIGRYDCRKVDIWAMGVTLYAMLAGKLPYYDLSTVKLYKLIQTSQYEPIKNIPSYLSLLLRAMIQKDPKKRININEIGQNIWIKDQLKQEQKLPTDKLQWNQGILRQMQKTYNISLKNLIIQMATNPISDFSTQYYLRSRKMNLNDNILQQDQIHDGPFHIQFVFKNQQLLESFLDKNKIDYRWVKNQKQQFSELPGNKQTQGQSLIKKYILINSEVLTIKKLKNLPKLMYIPLNAQLFKANQQKQKHQILETRQRINTNLNSSRSQLSNLCIQTF